MAASSISGGPGRRATAARFSPLTHAPRVRRKPSQLTDAQAAKLPASACPREWLSSEPSPRRRSLLAAHHSHGEAVAAIVTLAWILASLAGSLLLGAAFLRVFRRHAEGAVRATMVLQVRAGSKAWVGGWVLKRGGHLLSNWQACAAYRLN